MENRQGLVARHCTGKRFIVYSTFVVGLTQPWKLVRYCDPREVEENGEVGEGSIAWVGAFALMREGKRTYSGFGSLTGLERIRSAKKEVGWAE